MQQVGAGRKEVCGRCEKEWMPVLMMPTGLFRCVSCMFQELMIYGLKI